MTILVNLTDLGIDLVSHARWQELLAPERLRAKYDDQHIYRNHSFYAILRTNDFIEIILFFRPTWP